jgi:beta-N-acetylhexosaminidase
VPTTALPADLRRLVDTCLLPGFEGTTPPDFLRAALAEGLGGVCLFAKNIEPPDPHTSLRLLTAELRAANPNLLVAIDEEGGDVTRLDARTGSDCPGNGALGAVDDVAATRRIAATIAGRLAASGVNFNLAPVADVNNNPLNPVIGIRSFGADPVLVGRHVAAFVEGTQSRRVVACAKHFPGHGDTSADSHHELPVVTADRARLDEVELPPFAAAIAAGVRAIMTAHLVVPALDDRPATVSPAVLRLLRDELRYDGLVISDALEMGAIADTIGMGEAAVQALAAGVDLLCLGAEGLESQLSEVRTALHAALLDGRLTEDRLTEAAGRVTSLGQWAHDAEPGEPDPAFGLDVARRAIKVTGEPRLPVPPVVVELRGPGSMAVGEITWGVGEVLAQAERGTVVLPVTSSPPTVAPLLAPYADRPLVVVYRDAHLHPWQTATLAALRAARPAAVLVAMGGPHDLPAAEDGSATVPIAVLRTLGCGRVNAVAAAENLLGRELNA